MSTDKHDPNDSDMEDPDATRPAQKSTIPPPAEMYDMDSESDEATVMAAIPEALLEQSLRNDDEPRGGLRQMFSRDNAPPALKKEAAPEGERDALLDMLFEDAQEARPKAPAKPPALPPRKASAAIPPPPLAADDDGEEPTQAIDTDALMMEEAQNTADPETVDMPPEALVTPAAKRSTPAPAAAAPPADDEIDADLEALPEPIPSAAPEPLRATPIPSRMPPPVAFEREEDASALLLRSQQRDAWVARAEWLRTEAAANEDRAVHARSLLVVSELYAMTGEEATARAVAEEARELVPQMPMAHRQVRGLLTREGDWAGVLDVLEAEARSIAAPPARCHDAVLGAEIARLCLSDDEGSKKRIEHAARMQPSDPRAHVQRFCEALAQPEPDEGTPSSITKVRVPEAPELEPLPEATHQVAAHRGVKQAAPKHTASSYELLLKARAAAAAGNHGAVVAGLEALAQIPSLASGAGWLTGVLAAAKKETRARSVDALRAVSSGSHGALARRALAARAIELGDAAAARAATDSADSEAFSAADRIALAALTGGSRADVAPWIDALLGDPDLAPIAAAASAALDGDADGEPPHAVGGLRARTAATLGRALANGSPAALKMAVPPFADAAGESGVARALSLELDVDAGNGGRVARALSAWREDIEGERERVLASALIAEASGESERASSDYERLRLNDPTYETIMRAKLSHASGPEAATILTDHAQALEPGPRAALIFTEAAVRLTKAELDADALATLRRASDTDPRLPFAAHLGERAARARDDHEALAEWIRARREASEDPVEQAHDLVREARLLAENEPAAAAPLLEQALRARPSDAGLRETFERLSPEPPADRAEWRAARAAEATGVEAARLALEAALDLERAGDLEGSARLAAQAIAAGEQQLAPIAAYRAALGGQGTSDIIDALLPRARESADGVERLEVYERLAELDERGRGDAANGLLWRRAILDENPGHLPTLRRVASALIGAGRDDELEPIAIAIARTLEGPEAVAHAQLAARLRQKTSAWEETREPVEIAYKYEPRGTWALRQMAAHARASSQHGLAVEVDRQLIERTQRSSEAATLSLRTAESALKAGMNEDALAFFGHAIELAPGHIVAHLELAAALEAAGEHSGAATSLEAAAAACLSTEERANNLYRAAILWHDKVNDAPRARQALEAVAEINPSYGDVFQRLQAIYVADGARAELAALLERRLDAVTDPAERVEMEVLRGRALADVGDSAAAKRALAAALEANPDHVDALAAFGDVAAAEEDWSGAEQAWIRLARLVSDTARQTAIYLRLGELYDEHLPNPERAELAYQEILKREPADTQARERLVALFQKAGAFPRAIEEQTVLINGAEAPEAKCQRTTELARIYEVAGDAKKAEATLLQARKTWPKDDIALAALARFYQRNNQTPAANVLLDRAVADARRALATGRFEPYLFSTVATVAELRNRPDAARVAKAAVAALDGTDAALDGAGLSAADTALDELLAPEVVTPAFRELLTRTGPLLDTAVPYDLGSIRATPLPPQQTDLADQIQTLANGYGVHGVEVHVSTVLGAVCVPVSAHPPILALGQALIASTRDDVRAFLIHRALKILQANAAALSRTAPIDLWPLLAAYLKAFNTTWVPQGVDQGKLTDFYGKLSRSAPKGDPQLGLLATDVIGSIGNRASTLNTVVNGWGNRAGLLATGDLNAAITGIAWAGGHANAPPQAGKDRMTWIGRNAEARELVVFSVSDAYADARNRLGLG